jgi:hypothetical protein
MSVRRLRAHREQSGGLAGPPNRLIIELHQMYAESDVWQS